MGEGLADEERTFGNVARARKGAAGYDECLHGRTMHERPSGKSVAVQRSRHLDIGKKQRDVIPLREDRQSLVRTLGLEHLEAFVGEEIEDHHPDERLVLDDEHDRFVGRQD